MAVWQRGASADAGLAACCCLGERGGGIGAGTGTWGTWGCRLARPMCALCIVASCPLGVCGLRAEKQGNQVNEMAIFGAA